MNLAKTDYELFKDQLDHGEWPCKVCEEVSSLRLGSWRPQGCNSTNKGSVKTEAGLADCARYLLKSKDVVLKGQWEPCLYQAVDAS